MISHYFRTSFQAMEPTWTEASGLCDLEECMDGRDQSHIILRPFKTALDTCNNWFSLEATKKKVVSPIQKSFFGPKGATQEADRRTDLEDLAADSGETPAADFFFVFFGFWMLLDPQGIQVEVVNGRNLVKKSVSLSHDQKKEPFRRAWMPALATIPWRGGTELIFVAAQKSKKKSNESAFTQRLKCFFCPWWVFIQTQLGTEAEDDEPRASGNAGVGWTAIEVALTNKKWGVDIAHELTNKHGDVTTWLHLVVCFTRLKDPVEMLPETLPSKQMIWNWRFESHELHDSIVSDLLYCYMSII